MYLAIRKSVLHCLFKVNIKDIIQSSAMCAFITYSKIVAGFIFQLRAFSLLVFDDDILELFSINHAFSRKRRRIIYQPSINNKDVWQSLITHPISCCYVVDVHFFRRPHCNNYRTFFSKDSLALHNDSTELATCDSYLVTGIW